MTVVELAPVRAATLVLPTIARALGARQPDLDGLAGYLGQRRQLVVLDNLEHVLDVAPDVAELLARCPQLVVLATSRAALRIRAERERPLEPLPVPRRLGPGRTTAAEAARAAGDDDLHARRLPAGPGGRAALAARRPGRAGREAFGRAWDRGRRLRRDDVPGLADVLTRGRG